MGWMMWSAIGLMAYALFVLMVVRACRFVAAAGRSVDGARRRWELTGAPMGTPMSLEEELAALAEVTRTPGGARETLPSR